MDPISIVVTVLALYGLAKRSPQWAGEMAEEWRAARRGEESPAAAARRQRLIDAGVDPATGGPMRQYLGNRWRDYWLDADQAAAKRRADRLTREADGDVLSWRDRAAARLDDEVTRRAEQWRSRRPADTVPPVSTEPKPGMGPGPTTDQPDPDPDPQPQHLGPTAPGNPADEDAEPDPIPDGHKGPHTTTVHDHDSYRVGSGWPRYAPPPQADTDPNGGGVFSGWMRDAPPDADQHPDTAGGPIRVDAAVGDPIHPDSNQQTTAVAVLTTGGTMSNAVAQQAVTGVVSGAAEARALQAAIEQATNEYVATLTRLRNRIMSLGEQTLATVQMSGRSQVVNHTAAAAEAAAAATANARACTAEVTPLLGAVARAFDRINS